MLRLITTLALATPLAAQTVLVVDDDGGAGVDHTTLQAALNAAPSGAVINVRDGVYTGATIDAQSVVVTTEASGSVVVQGGLTIQNLAPNQVATVRGLGIVDSSGNQTPLRIQQNQGVVWIEGCLVLVDNDNHAEGVLVDNCTSVVLRVTTIASSSANSEAVGLRAQNSSIHAYDFHAEGSDNATAPGCHGVELIDSFLYASESRFEGGDGGIDCQTGCLPQPGGAGIRVLGPGGSNANLTNTFLIGGQGGVYIGVPAPNGPPSDVINGILSQQTDTLRNTLIPSPVRTNEMANITIKGAPGEFVFALYSDTPNTLFIPSLFDSFVVGAPLSSFFLTTLDATGTAAVQMAPTLPAGILARTLYTQMFHYDPTAPPGSQIDLGTPTSLVILDESF